MSKPFPPERKLAIAHSSRAYTFACTANPLLTHFLESASNTLGVSKAEFLRRLLLDAMEKWILEQLYSVPEEAKAYTRTALREAPKGSNPGHFRKGRPRKIIERVTPQGTRRWEVSMPPSLAANSASED